MSYKYYSKRVCETSETRVTKGDKKSRSMYIYVREPKNQNCKTKLPENELQLIFNALSQVLTIVGV